MPKCLHCKTPLLIKLRGSHRRTCSDRCRQAAYRKERKKPKRLAALLSSKSVEWYTPRDFFAKLVAEFGAFDLDPCATAENAVCARFFSKEQDGLAQRWDAKRVFMNPPFGRAIPLWMAKAVKSVRIGDAELIVCLVPVRTDARWWHEYATQGEIRFLKGRLKFGGCENSAPFGCALVILRGDKFVTSL
jgi:phage N-6-adenine-methyltransferase